jgi:hypothetical protein
LKLLTLFSCPFSSYQAVWNIGSLHFREWCLLQVSLLSSSFSIFFYIKTSMEVLLCFYYWRVFFIQEVIYPPIYMCRSSFLVAILWKLGFKCWLS